MHWFEARLGKLESGIWTVDMPAFPGYQATGSNKTKAFDAAVEVLQRALSDLMSNRREIPTYSEGYAGGRPSVNIPHLTYLKVRLYEEMLRSNLSTYDLAEGMGINVQQASRLLDLSHNSHLDSLAKALAAVDLSLRIKVD